MGLAIDTVAFQRLSGAGADAAPVAASAAPGDSFTVRSFAAPATARLERVMYQGRLSDILQIKSVLMHDAVEGIQFVPGQSPAKRLLPKGYGQQLNSQDTLTVALQVGAATTQDAGALSIYYSNLGGSAARLHMPADYLSSIKNLKVLRVTMPAGGAAVTWLDAVITTTENLLHANTDYAVLGYLTDTPLVCVGLKGIDTGNLRVCGPGTVDDLATMDYFAQLSLDDGTPHVPVFNAANAGSTFISAFGVLSPTGANIQLICAELGANLPAA